MPLSTVIKRKLKSWSLKRSKLLLTLYTLLVLFIGILIGGHYEGRDKEGTYYYHVFGLTFYGGFNHDKN